MTNNSDIPFAKSIVDYVFRWMGLTFIEDYRKKNLPQRSKPAGGSLSTQAAPEAVKDDASSESESADRASDREVASPVGALFQSLYLPTGGNGGGKAGKQAKTAVPARAVTSRPTPERVERVDQQFSHYQEDAPACDVCGSITVRNGNCYKCYNCGSSLGCS